MSVSSVGVRRPADKQYPVAEGQLEIWKRNQYPKVDPNYRRQQLGSAYVSPLGPTRTIQTEVDPYVDTLPSENVTQSGGNT